MNREYHKKYSQTHYERNKQQYRDRESRNRREAAERVWNYIKDKFCIDCGEENPIVLEFDHVKGIKIGDISTLVAQRKPWQTIRDEIEKCEVVCANCHKLRTARRANHYKHQFWIKANLNAG